MAEVQSPLRGDVFRDSARLVRLTAFLSSLRFDRRPQRFTDKTTALTLNLKRSLAVVEKTPVI